jgi:hypothetical protein
MRVGDAEREAAAAEVREHFASGRLTQDELNQRLDQTFAAKTRGDLNAVFTDLPTTGSWRSAAAGSAAGAGYDRRSGGGSFGPGGSGSRARQAVGFGVSVVTLFAAFLVFGIVGVFGIGSGRPLALVLLFAAFAMLRRLLFLIFGRRRGGGRGPRRRRW